MERHNLIQKLRTHLQTAIEIEHATLPPYLTAYWSIHGNSLIAETASAMILSVIREEMLHMGMACNILNAVGGKPVINHQGFIPEYPGYLPGHSHTINAFKVHLEPCSASSIRTFMLIELPEKAVGETVQKEKWATIGQFYEMIIRMIQDPLLTDADFNHGGQIDNSANPAKGILFTVHNKKDALNAIKEILDQGEGHSAHSHYDKDHELTHYWKFNEIFQLIKKGEWEIEKDVYPVASDPDVADFSPEAIQLNHIFNSNYSALLDALHNTYNNTEDVDDSIRLMLALEPLAKKLMQIPLMHKPGNACPTFRYVEADARIFS